jgi:hypothetical protein
MRVLVMTFWDHFRAGASPTVIMRVTVTLWM